MSPNLRILAWPAFKAKFSPYNALLYGSVQQLGCTVEELTPQRVLSRRYDILHLHWPEYCVNGRGVLSSLFWSCALVGAVSWIRICGGKVVWTVHNIGSHLQEHPIGERCFWKVLTALLNGYICLTEKSKEDARQRFPSLRKLQGFVIPHGNIRDGYPNVELSRDEARSRLGISAQAKVLTFFGSIQTYKGVPELVDSFIATRDTSSILLVAGQCSLPRQERDRIEKAAERDRRVVLRLDFIPNAELAFYIRASDLVVLPFRTILNSGSAVLALSLDRPVLVPAKGAMLELEAFAGTEWVRLFTGELTAELLQNELDRVIVRAPNRGRCHVFENGWAGLGWPELAQMTVDAYRCLCNAAPATSKKAKLLR